MTLSPNRNVVLARIEVLRERISAGGLDGRLRDPKSRKVFEDAQAITFGEHFAYQNAQARAFASGRITQAEALLVYQALGEVGSAKNGGWAAGTDLATKCAVTQLMAELLR